MRRIFSLIYSMIVYSAVVCLIALVGAAGWLGYECKSSHDKAISAQSFADTWLTAAARGDIQTAYSSTTQRFRDRTSMQRFADYMRASGIRSDGTPRWKQATHGKSVRGVAEVGGSFPATGGASRGVVITLVDRDGWKVDGIDIGDDAATLSDHYKILYRGQYGAGSIFKRGATAFYASTACEDAGDRVVPIGPPVDDGEFGCH